VLFFLRSLKKQKDNLAAKLKRERVLARVLLPLSLEILSLLREHERLGISELESLTGANRNTLKVRLRELTEGHHIARHGRGKATSYTLSLAGS
jgi:predicted transcriptional regulator